MLVLTVPTSGRDGQAELTWVIDREFEFYAKIHDFLNDFKTGNFKIHKIQIITFFAVKFQQIFVANTALDFWIKSSVMSTVNSLIR